MPEGLLSARSPFKVSTSAVEPAEMSDRDDTVREFESPPDMDQPPCPAVLVALTGSSKVTRISRSETASAPVTAGAWPSSRSSELGVAGSRLLPAASANFVRSTARVPVALAAAVAPVNVIVWTADGVPVVKTRFAVDPPCTRSRLVYADACAVTGSLYAIASSFSPVTLADRTVGAWPSSTCCRNVVDRPAALPYASVSCVWSTVRSAESSAAACAPPNVSTCTVPVPFPENRLGAPRSPPRSSTRPTYADALA